jgi:hypothetical protein
LQINNISKIALILSILLIYNCAHTDKKLTDFGNNQRFEIEIENQSEYLTVVEKMMVTINSVGIYTRLKTMEVLDNDVNLNNLNVKSDKIEFEIVATEKNLLDGKIDVLLTEILQDEKDSIITLYIPVKKKN